MAAEYPSGSIVPEFQPVRSLMYDPSEGFYEVSDYEYQWSDGDDYDDCELFDD